jgi:hypothetical protein
MKSTMAGMEEDEGGERGKKAATEVFKHPTSCSIDFLLVSACEIHSQLCDTMENLFPFPRFLHSFDSRRLN